MPKLTSEATFETVIEAALLNQHGYLRAKPEDYDRDLCLYPTTVLRFVQVTQPEKWASYVRLLGSDAGPRLLRRLRDVIDRKGTLNALRRGVDESGHHFDLCYFQPTSALNPDLVRLFEANVFQVVRQLKYSKYNDNSLDLAIFLNGLPIFTAEMKNQVSGQNVEHAKKQYREDRDPKEPLLTFRRCLAHFAVDTQLVRFTTELTQKSTRFHPFDQVHDGGAGNPPSATGYATSYLWERIWSRVSVLDLIQRFIRLIKVVDEKGRITGKEALIFPRYHQLDTVRRCTAHAQTAGPGHAYLNQHSAGSGKTIEIATLANSLSLLHGADNKPVFNTVIVVSDRRVIDRQLQRNLAQFTDTPGVLENIDEGSRQLADALRDGKKIIVSTLQKFPFLLEKIADLPALRFAVIIDEAHSSQSGTAAMELNKVLAVAEKDGPDPEGDDRPDDDWEDRINDAMQALGRRPHVSYFAFTATPKEETLRLFGTEHPDGSYRPFTLYPMRQAIEEGFILDVLRNYTSYDQYFNLLNKAKDDPTVDKAKAQRLLKQFVHDDRRPIRRKARIMVDHFRTHMEGRIGGRAKAMIVTRNRLNAVRFAVEVRNYLAELGNPWRCLVAFTGTVRDPENGAEFTESGMNGFPETQTANEFEGTEARILVVANKYQTGFDQPLLSAMYVDRKLRGVTAVQTLSRLNRTTPGKETTVVVDFENDPEEICKAFQRFYDRTELTEGHDPNRLYDIKGDLDDKGFYTAEEVEELAKAQFGRGTEEAKIQRLHAITDPIVERFKILDPDPRTDARAKLHDYVKLYAFLAQVLPFSDARLFQFFAFSSFLAKKLPSEKTSLPTHILGDIDLDAYRPQETGTQDLSLNRGIEKIEPREYGADHLAPTPDVVPLSKIIEDLNAQFGTKFNEEDRQTVSRLLDKALSDPVLDQQRHVSSKDALRLSFEQVVQSMLSDLVDSNFKFYRKVTDDRELAKELYDQLFERFYQQKVASQKKQSTPSHHT